MPARAWFWQLGSRLVRMQAARGQDRAGRNPRAKLAMPDLGGARRRRRRELTIFRVRFVPAGAIRKCPRTHSGSARQRGGQMRLWGGQCACRSPRENGCGRADCLGVGGDVGSAGCAGAWLVGKAAPALLPGPLARPLGGGACPMRRGSERRQRRSKSQPNQRMRRIDRTSEAALPMPDAIVQRSFASLPRTSPAEWLLRTASTSGSGS